MSVTNGGTALKPFSNGGSFSGSAGSAGISITLRTAHFPFFPPSSRNHIQIEDERSLSEMPTLTKPEVVSQLLWATILFPGPPQLKRVRVHQENATGAVSASRSECAPVDAVRSTMKCVGRRVAGLLYELFGLDHLHDLWLPGIRFRI